MRILIIDDHRLFAEAIRRTLVDEGIEVIDVVDQAEEGLEAARRERPDLVMVDLGLPGADGMDVGREILDDHPDTKVVAVTAMDDQRTVKEALARGFHGYLTKDTPIARFVDSVRAAAAGQAVFPHGLVNGRNVHRSEDERNAALLADQLTPREVRVLALLVEGANGDTIRERLDISPNTVRTHIQNILNKLQVHSRLEAATFAVRWGIVRMPGRNGNAHA